MHQPYCSFVLSAVDCWRKLEWWEVGSGMGRGGVGRAAGPYFPMGAGIIHYNYPFVDASPPTMLEGAVRLVDVTAVN